MKYILESDRLGNISIYFSAVFLLPWNFINQYKTF